MKNPLFCLATAVAALFAGPLSAEDAKPVPAATVKNVTTDEVQKLLKADSKIVVIDVRTADEYAAGHIAGAKNIDIMADDFAKQIATLDKTQTYVFLCAAGGRSARACALPGVQQLKSVYHMNEGYKAWEKSGKPVKQGSGQ